MKKIKIRKSFKNKGYALNKFNNISSFYHFLLQKSHSILISINFALTIFLFIQNSRVNTLIKELSLTSSFNIKDNDIDKDMIGLKYPEIKFEKIKGDYINGKIVSSFCDFLKQLEIKLIYLEKEINVTRLNAFYTARTIYLKERHVKYDDAKITEYHDIINWIMIHKSNQLKGIASDKYLACKYVQIKLGKNLCPQRIGVYNNVEEIDFEKLIKMGNVVLKVSNGFDDNIFIRDNVKLQDIDKIKQDLIYHYNRDYSLLIPGFSHAYSKKRIVLEKIFIPFSDLFEFRIFVFNHLIKMIILEFEKSGKRYSGFYDENFNSIKDIKVNFDMSIFKRSLLDELKLYAIKLSEDFPNFIRVDLYIFHDQIYLSELTFDSYSGIPVFRDIKYFNDGLKNWKRVDY